MLSSNCFAVVSFLKVSWTVCPPCLPLGILTVTTFTREDDHSGGNTSPGKTSSVSSPVLSYRKYTDAQNTTAPDTFYKHSPHNNPQYTLDRYHNVDAKENAWTKRTIMPQEYLLQQLLCIGRGLHEMWRLTSWSLFRGVRDFTARLASDCGDRGYGPEISTDLGKNVSAVLWFIIIIIVT